MATRQAARTIVARSHAQSLALEALLAGPLRAGKAAGGRLLVVGRYVISFTDPGLPRMPNGIECELPALVASRIAIGRERIELGDFIILPGPAWDPVPQTINVRSFPPGPEPVGSLAALGLGGPSDHDLIAGYVAGLVLLHDQRDRARRIADRVTARALPLDSTLLDHASRGEVPEPVHTLLATGDPAQLLGFSGSRGHGWLRGLVSAGLVLETWPKSAVSAVAPPIDSRPRRA